MSAQSCSTIKVTIDTDEWLARFIYEHLAGLFTKKEIIKVIKKISQTFTQEESLNVVMLVFNLSVALGISLNDAAGLVCARARGDRAFKKNYLTDMGIGYAFLKHATHKFNGCASEFGHKYGSHVIFGREVNKFYTQIITAIGNLLLKIVKLIDKQVRP